MRYILSLLYPVCDFILIISAVLCSYKLYRFTGIGQNVFYEQSEIFSAAMLSGFISVIICFNFGVYRKESGLLSINDVQNALKGLTASFFIISVIIVFLKISPSRYILLFSYFMSVFFVLFGKTILLRYLLRFNLSKYFTKKVLIYGAGELGQSLYRTIANSPGMGIDVIGFIDDDRNKQEDIYLRNGFDCSNGISVLGEGKDIKLLQKQYDFDEVYLAISNIENSNLIMILETLQAVGIRVSFVPNLYKIPIHKLTIKKIGEIPIASEIEKYNYFYFRYAKRYMDLLVASILFLLFMPFAFIIALAIKFDSKGPVFFKQNRVGKDGVLFEIYKFRTMITNSDPYAVNPLEGNDPRITRVGRFLRRTSLDELPQLINVLKGDMSLVGPRPEMPFIVSEYNEFHKERLKALPGITGLWQLSGDRNKAIHENMDYDLYYIKNVSFFLDIAILLETLLFAFRGV
jgi:exopolysaccharide biosynthesis polyprenyl glycosylphosphotransferase